MLIKFSRIEDRSFRFTPRTMSSSSNFNLRQQQDSINNQNDINNRKANTESLVCKSSNRLRDFISNFFNECNLKPSETEPKPKKSVLKKTINYQDHNCKSRNWI